MNTENNQAVDIDSLSQPRSAGHSSGDRTRNRLLNEALQLFAVQGIGAVSIRTIVAAAGAQNLSAVHYHFGNKEGLVDAIAVMIADHLLPAQNEALSRLKSLSEPTVREIISCAYSPYLDMAIESEKGMQQAKFLARLTWEEGDRGQKLLVQKLMGPVILAVEPLLVKALPKQPRAELQLKLAMSLSSLVHGTADRSVVQHLPLSDVRDTYAADPAATRERFFDFIAAGISAASY